MDSVETADRFLAEVETTIERLGDFPGIGHPRTDLSPKLKDVRSFAVDGFPNHLIFYRKTRGGIEIVRVLHGARDLRVDLLRPT